MRLLTRETASMHRIGIIPFDIQANAIALLFVTSQTRGRWILPKGRAQPDETHSDTCHREGFEEAGVRGVVLEDFPFTVLITKQADGSVRQVPVTYYPYLVQQQEDEWPEMDRRQRHWALIEDAPKVAYREDFLGVIRQFESLKSWIKEAADQHKSQQPKQLMPAP
ncbi:hypothetical protein MnTg02_01172 [bacterium MnTg02]|nr:hypothetical protein MnTg02_01172 [bacterium MnTg02]